MIDAELVETSLKQTFAYHASLVENLTSEIAQLGLTNDLRLFNTGKNLLFLMGTPDFMPFFTKLQNVITEVKYEREHHPLGYVVPWSLVYGLIPLIGEDLPCKPYNVSGQSRKLFSASEEFCSQSAILSRFSNAELAEFTSDEYHPSLSGRFDERYSKLCDYELVECDTNRYECLATQNTLYYKQLTSRTSSILKKLANNMLSESGIDASTTKSTIDEEESEENLLNFQEHISKTVLSSSSVCHGFGNEHFPYRLHPHDLRLISPKAKSAGPLKNGIPFNQSSFRFIPNHSEKCGNLPPSSLPMRPFPLFPGIQPNAMPKSRFPLKPPALRKDHIFSHSNTTLSSPTLPKSLSPKQSITTDKPLRIKKRKSGQKVADEKLNPDSINLYLPSKKQRTSKISKKKQDITLMRGFQVSLPDQTAASAQI